MDQVEKQSTAKGQETFPETFENEKAAMERRKGQRRCNVTPNFAVHELYDTPEAGNQSEQRKSPDHRKLRSAYVISKGSADDLCETEEVERESLLSHGTGSRREESLPEEHWTVDALIFGRVQGNKAETEDDLCKLSLSEKMSLDDEPITTKEVRKTSVSPLATSVLKPLPIEVLRSPPGDLNRETGVESQTTPQTQQRRETTIGGREEERRRRGGSHVEKPDRQESEITRHQQATGKEYLDEKTSSSPHDCGLKIKNQTTAHRRQQLQKQNRPKTSSLNCQPQNEESIENQTERQMKYGRRGRQHTQPITSEERDELSSEGKHLVDIRGFASHMQLHDRLTSLQRGGEMEWKRRLHDTRDASPSTALEEAMESEQQQQQQQQKFRPTSSEVRLPLFHSGQDLGNERVEVKDISQFTIEGKMSKFGISADRSYQQLPKKSGRPAIVRAPSSPNLSSVFPDDGFRDQTDDERTSAAEDNKRRPPARDDDDSGRSMDGRNGGRAVSHDTRRLRSLQLRRLRPNAETRSLREGRRRSPRFGY